MGFANWPAYQDGTGTYMDGKVPDAALLNAIRADLEADLFVGAISPENLIDEVVLARGTEASLDARLDVSINEDGTLKEIADTVTVDELVHTQNVVHPVPVLNPTFELWRYNTAAATPWDPAATEVPEGWSLTGVGIAAGGHILSGSGARYVIQLDNLSPTFPGYFSQVVVMPTEMSNFMRQWQTGDRKITFGAVVASSIVGDDAARLFVDDGVRITRGPNITSVGGVYHTSVTHTINSHATYLSVGIEIDQAATAQYQFASPYVIFNDVPIPADAVPGAQPTRWPYRTGMFHYPRIGERRIAGFSGLNHGNVVAGVQTVLWRAHDGIPAAGVQFDATPIRIQAAGTIAANADANKILRVYIGTHWVEVFNTAANIANNVWNLDVLVMRAAAGTAHLYGTVTFNAAALATPTTYHISSIFAGGAVNWDAGAVLSINGASATANTVVLWNGIVTYPGAIS